MLLSVILLMLSVPGDANDVTRDVYGDIFRMRDCHNGSRCDDGGRRAALQIPGRPCYCQCAPSHLAYREDKQQCVKDIKECYMSVFYRPFTIEAIPFVFLPTSGQLVHPDAHLSLSMRRNFEGGLAKCRVSVSQYLTRDGFRTLTKMDGTGGSVFGLFTDANKTYLQFLGNSHDRKLLQHHMVLIRLLCIIPQYPAFETCVAVRIGWVPGVENIEDVTTPSNKGNMMIVGLSLGVLVLVYIFAVLVYLKIRRQMLAKQKANTDQEAKLQSRDDSGDKTSTLHRMESSNRLELYHTASLGRQKSSKKGYRNNCDPWSQMSPLVETYNRTWTDRMGQHSSEFKAQDFKLQPEFFEPEFMASPPHEVLEYLERLQNSITFARHRMRSCYRYQPTLNGIPEDDYFYQELEKKDPPNKDVRTTPDGGSASSVSSLQDSNEQKNDSEERELPKIPPRKPKRKAAKENICSPESAHSSDQEQKEIQKAMNTLNDTLDALEYDMYKQEILTQTSDSETTNLSCQNSTSIDFDDFETSSCSSLSAVTVLGRDAKRHSDISKCNQFMEKNQSEDFSTFRNSTYSLCEGMRGLFHDGNKTSCNIELERSNLSSRCSSEAGYLSQIEEQSNGGLVKGRKFDANHVAQEDSGMQKQCNSESHVLRNIRPKSRTDNVNNSLAERNIGTHEEISRNNSCTPSHFKNINSSDHSESEQSSNGKFRKRTYFSTPNNYKHGSNNTLNHTKNGQGNIRITDFDENKHRTVSTPNKENAIRNISTPTLQSAHRNVGSPNLVKQHKILRTPCQEESRHSLTKSFNLKDNDEKDIKISNFDGVKERIGDSLLHLDTVSKGIITPNCKEVRTRNARSPNPHGNGHVKSNTPNKENGHKESNASYEENGHNSNDSPNNEKQRSNIRSPDSENYKRVTTPNKANNDFDSLDLQNINPVNVNALNMKRKENKIASDSESFMLRKSTSSESLNTIATDMTTDSLDSRCATPNHPSPTPSLMEMWINKLVSTSVPYSKTRRKLKKKLILAEEDVDSWEHVCQKHKDPCAKHDLNDSEPNLIDKLAHYSSKTMAGCDVAGYFQSLKQDVLKEHLKQWLSSNNQNKKHKKGISLEYSNECSHKKPLVNGQENNLVDEHGMHLSGKCLTETLNDFSLPGDNINNIDDSLESDTGEKLNDSNLFGGQKEVNEKSVET